MSHSSELLISSLLNPDSKLNGSFLTTDDGDIPMDTLTSTLQELQRMKGMRQQQLYDLVKSQLDTFLATYKHATDIRDTLSTMSTECIEATALVLDPNKGILASTKNALAQYRDLTGKRDANEQILKALEELLKLVENMDHAETVGKSGRMVDATHVYQEIDQQLGATALPWCTENVDIGLQQRLSLCRDTLIETSQEFFRAAMDFEMEEGSMTIRKQMTRSTTSSGNTVHIKDIFQSWLLLDALPAQISSIKKSIFRHIITPFFNQCHQTRVEIDDSSSSVANLRLEHLQQKQKQQGGEEEEKEEKFATLDGVELIENVSKILQFISNHLLDGYDASSRVAQMFGNMFLPDVLNLLIEKGLMPLIPASYEELYKFERINEAAKSLEQQCRDWYGFNLEQDNNDNENNRRSLSAFIAGVDGYFANKRAAKIMMDGRQIMMRRLYDTEETDEPGKGTNNKETRRYKITQTPKLLFILLSETLAEASKLDQTHPVSAKKLRNTVTDLIDLYRAIMPSYHRSFLTANPGSILVFENDCRWLAKAIESLSFDDNKAQSMQQITERLRLSADKVSSLADLWQQVAVKQCVKQLHTILNDTHGFVSIAENRQVQDQCERAVTKVIHAIHLYAEACRPVVDESTYTNIVANVVDNVLIRIINDIESLSDIGAEDSHYIARSLNSLLQLIQVFDLPGRDATEAFVMELVPNWNKFWQLNRILEMNLREIMEAYNSGELRAFTKSELISLICALFADTEIRERSILEIKTADPQRQQIRSPPSSTVPAPRTVTSSTSQNSLAEKTPEPIPTTSSSPPAAATEQEPKKARLAFSMEPQDMEEDQWGWGDADEEISGWDDNQDEDGWGDLDEKLNL